MTIAPRKQKILSFDISSQFNIDSNHSCTGKKINTEKKDKELMTYLFTSSCFD